MKQITITDEAYKSIEQMAEEAEIPFDDCSMELILFGLQTYRKFSQFNADRERNYEEDDFMDAEFEIDFIEGWGSDKDYIVIRKDSGKFEKEIRKEALACNDDRKDTMWNMLKKNGVTVAFCRLYDDGKFEIIKVIEVPEFP